MTFESPKKLYTGRPESRGTARKRWADFIPAGRYAQDDPADYLASPELTAAVNVALELGMPLLLTGEPGCDKSRLADALAFELGLPSDWDGDSYPPEEKRLNSPLRFVVKSETEGHELFYRFDTLARFHAANRPREVQAPGSTSGPGGDSMGIDPRRFIRYQALGLALLLAKGRDAIPAGLMLDAERRRFPEEPRRSVVLIDEIDKAPREVPNDLLDEIENLRFQVPELDYEGDIELSEEEKLHRPIVVITSNSERELPPAFLRRCIYFHLGLPPFSGGEYSVEAIVRRRLGQRFEAHPSLFGEAIGLFRFIRGDTPEQCPVSRPPSLAEFLDWLRVLSRRLPEAPSLERHPDFRGSLYSLLKNRDDLLDLENLLNAWRERSRSAGKS